MTEKLYNVMNWADVEEVTYVESAEPKRILGPHLIEEGLLIQAFLPGAKEVSARLDGKGSFPMELADEAGFYAVLIPKEAGWKKKLPRYTIAVSFSDGREENYSDPYAFPSVWTDEDLKKFGAGIHYDVYRKLGAHPGTFQGEDGVLFSVWAPNAMRVSVVGDFNQWDGRRHMMQKVSESGIFELFVPGAREGMMYKFEIRRRGYETMLKSDPYAYGFEARPNSASIIRSLDEFAWKDDAWQKEKAGLKHEERPMSIFEVHLGTFYRKQKEINEDGTPVNNSEYYNYRELADRLASYAKKQSFTHVELLPVMEFRDDSTLGYQSCGIYAPSSRFGNVDDFRYLVNRLHKDGIGVILDWNPAGFAGDGSGLSMFDGTALYENPDPSRMCDPVSGAFMYNHQRLEVTNYLISNAFYWAEEYHIDGLRLTGLASMLYLDYGRQENAPRNMFGGNENLEAMEFLKHLNSQFKKHFPGVLLIADETAAIPNMTGKVEDGGLGFDMKWNRGWTEDLLLYMKTDPFFRKNSFDRLTVPMVYQYSEDFILALSHRELSNGKGSLLAKMPGQSFEERAQHLRTFYGYFWTHPGKKLLFMTQDFGQYDEWTVWKEAEWNLLDYPVHKELQAYVRDMNEVYRSHPALWKLDNYPDGFEWINCTYRDLSLLFFVRKTEKPEETLLVVLNFDNIAHTRFRVGVPFACAAKAIITSDEKKYGGFGIVRKAEIKAKKQEWDEREYSIEINIPAMSATIYQLTPVSMETEEGRGRKKAGQSGKNKGVQEASAMEAAVKENAESQTPEGEKPGDSDGKAQRGRARKGRQTESGRAKTRKSRLKESEENTAIPTAGGDSAATGGTEGKAGASDSSGAADSTSSFGTSLKEDSFGEELIHAPKTVASDNAVGTTVPEVAASDGAVGAVVPETMASDDAGDTADSKKAPSDIASGAADSEKAASLDAGSETVMTAATRAMSVVDESDLKDDSGEGQADGSPSADNNSKKRTRRYAPGSGASDNKGKTSDVDSLAVHKKPVYEGDEKKSVAKVIASVDLESTAKNAVKAVREGAAKKAASGKAAIGKVVAEAPAMVRDGIQTVQEGVQNGLQTVQDGVQSGIQTVQDGIQTVQNGIQTVQDKMSKASGKGRSKGEGKSSTRSKGDQKAAISKRRKG